MTNPTRWTTVLADGTVPNIQPCITDAAISTFAGSLVQRSAGTNANGVKKMEPILPDGKDITGDSAHDIGIIEIEEVVMWSTIKWDQETEIPDTKSVNVHWLRHGDVILANATAADHGALVVGDPMIVITAGTLGSPAETTIDIYPHMFVVVPNPATALGAVDTGDTIVKVKYIGMGAADAA